MADKFQERTVKHMLNWIRDYFTKQGPGTKAVIGISGGKDSTVCAALLCRALGPENVIAVKMPNGSVIDEDDLDFDVEAALDVDAANDVINMLGIPHANVWHINIAPICEAYYSMLKHGYEDDPVVATNLPARVRMTILYAIANHNHGRVCNTSNRSEAYVGYTTKWGDNVGDFSLLGHCSTEEVKELGRLLGISEKFLEKPPADGLSGKTDEENMGIAYADINTVMEKRKSLDVPYDVYEKIERRHNDSEHKRCVELPTAHIIIGEGLF